MNFSAELDNQKLSISAVDKRSTAIVTPLPRHRTALRYMGWSYMGREIPEYCRWSSIAGKTEGNDRNSMNIIYEKKVFLAGSPANMVPSNIVDIPTSSSYSSRSTILSKVIPSTQGQDD